MTFRFRLFVLLAGVIACATACGCKKPPKTPPAAIRPAAPGIIIISLDTLRADRLGCYGCERKTSPFIDSLAARSVRFAHVYSQAPRTAPSHMTLFTGLYPSEHQVRFDYPSGRDAIIHPLGSGVTTMAQVLKRSGYRTAAFVEPGELAGEGGFNRGFDIYREGGHQWSPGGLKPVQEWLSEAGAGSFFLFLHTYQIHDPYLPPPPYNRMFDPDYKGWIIDTREELLKLAGKGGYDYLAGLFWGKGQKSYVEPSKYTEADRRHLLALYDGDIAYADSVLAKLFAWMEKQPWWGRTMVIILSDHGEEFFEHGGYLHRKLYVETVHVPLIVHYPGDAGGGKVIDEPLGLIEVQNLVLAPRDAPFRAGWPLTRMNGRFALRGKAVGPVISQEPWLIGQPQQSVRDGRFSLYIKGNDPLVLELFDVTADPGEHHDLSVERPDEVKRLRAALNDALPVARKEPVAVRQSPPRDKDDEKADLDPNRQPGLRSKENPRLGRPLPTQKVERAPDAPAPKPIPGDEDRKKKLRALGYIQ